jgi:uroporphyrinogen-III synthase
MRVLVTRPEPDGEHTAIRLRAHHCDVMLAPLLRMQAVDADHIETSLHGAWDAIALTSVNAIRAVAGQPGLKLLLARPVYAVGGRTADAALAQGFASVVSADGDIGDLVRLMKTQLRPGAHVIYLAGEDRSGDLAGELAPAGIAVRTLVVYRATAVSRFPADVRDALAARMMDAVLHFSRRTAAIYLACAAGGRITVPALAPAHYCLSPRVAEPLTAAGARKIRIAEEPTEASLIDLVKG